MGSREEEKSKKQKRSSYSSSPEARRPAIREGGDEGDGHRRLFLVKKDESLRKEEDGAMKNGSDVRNAKAKSGSESEVSHFHFFVSLFWVVPGHSQVLCIFSRRLISTRWKVK